MNNKFLITLFVFAQVIFSSYGQSIDNLRNRAESGDPVAQYNLAITYLNSKNKDYIKCLNLLRQSSKHGVTAATKLLKELSTPGYDAWGDYVLTPYYDLGILSEDTKSVYLERAANGQTGYLPILAHSLFHEKKYKEAVHYYKQALSQMKTDNLGKFEGDEFCLHFAWMDSYTMLGYCYEHGFGVEKNLTTALHYYFIGGIYSDGDHTRYLIGIKKILQEINNPELTAECLGEEGTYTDGIQIYDALVPSAWAIRPWNRPGVLFIKMGKYSLAKEYLCEDMFGLESGVIRDLWIGEMYYKGLGRPQDYAKAYEYFDYIVEKIECGGFQEVYESYPDIYADACYRLYECFAYGRGVEREANKAEKYFKLSLRFGSSSAIYDDQRRYEIMGQ